MINTVYMGRTTLASTDEIEHGPSIGVSERPRAIPNTWVVH